MVASLCARRGEAPRKEKKSRRLSIRRSLYMMEAMDTIRLAPSAERVPYSRIRELAEIAMTMDGVLKLYFGESNLPTPQYIKDAAMRAMQEGHTFYTENAGYPSLRRAIAAKYRELH